MILHWAALVAVLRYVWKPVSFRLDMPGRQLKVIPHPSCFPHIDMKIYLQSKENYFFF